MSIKKRPTTKSNLKRNLTYFETPLKKKKKQHLINLKYAGKMFYSPKYSKTEFTYRGESDLLPVLSRARK